MKSLIYAWLASHRSKTVQQGSRSNWKKTYNAMELGALVSDRAAVGPARLARAELPEVLGRSGHCVGEELHLDAAEGLAFGTS
jgi:hypothetical protein